MVTNTPIINVQYRNIRNKSSVIGNENTTENTKKLQMPMKRIMLSIDNDSCQIRQGAIYLWSGRSAKPNTRQHPNVTNPNKSDAKSLLPLYILNPNGCSKYSIKNTMIQYTIQSLSQWLLNGNGYFRDNIDISCAKIEYFPDINNCFLNKIYNFAPKL